MGKVCMLIFSHVIILEGISTIQIWLMIQEKYQFHHDHWMVLSEFKPCMRCLTCSMAIMNSFFIFPFLIHISLIMIKQRIMWFLVWLAGHINTQTLILTTIIENFRSKIEEFSQLSLTSNFIFLHTNTKDSCRLLILVLHWARFTICLLQLSQNSSCSCALSCWWKFEI
jgi:hypothetical protein